MAAGTVELEITQGEDWTVDMVWTDNYDTGMPVVHPCRMRIKAQDGSTLTTLVTDPDLPETEIPGINVSTNLGLLQLHITSEVSANFPPGAYSYDLFATTNDGNTYGGPQQISLVSGAFFVNKRITEL